MTLFLLVFLLYQIIYLTNLFIALTILYMPEMFSELQDINTFNAIISQKGQWVLFSSIIQIWNPRIREMKHPLINSTWSGTWELGLQTQAIQELGSPNKSQWRQTVCPGRQPLGSFQRPPPCCTSWALALLLPDALLQHTEEGGDYRGALL